jgi:hypothetical protein
MSNLIQRASARNSTLPLFRTRLIYAGWVTITSRRDGTRRSIPVLRRRPIPITDGKRGQA